MAVPHSAAPSAAIAAWGRGLCEQWDEDVLGGDPERVEIVARFCEAIAMDPDALVAHCFLRRRATGERFASVPRRADIRARLEAYVAASSLPLAAQRRVRSVVLSFLIHNGVQM